MDVVSYKCPNCAAGLSFDIEKQSWHCKFCSGDFTLEQLQAMDPDAAAAQAADAPDISAGEPQQDAPLEMETPQWESPHEQFSGDAVSFSCPSCGGQIVTDKNTAATFCIFCHNPTVITSRLEDQYRPARMIPFKLQKDTVLEALHKLCKKRPLLPADFRKYAEKGEVSGLYVPFWLYDAEIDAQMSATGRQIRTWSDSNYRYTKTDTYRVERKAKLTFHNVPADGSKKMDDKLMDALEPFDFSQMTEFSMHYLSGHFAESYDVDANEAAGRALPRMRQSVERMMKGELSRYASSTVHSLTSSPRKTDSTYVMLPVWVLMTEYEGETYTFAMNGQTGKIAGNLPLSRSRYWQLFGKIAGVVAAIVFVGGMIF